MVWLIERVVLVLTLVIWAVVAFLLWIPLLARSIAVFSSGIVLSVLSQTTPQVYARQLRLAMSFYADGFRFILDSILAERRTDTDRDNAEPPIHGLGRFIAESLWAILFWLTFLFGLDRYGLAPSFFHDAMSEVTSLFTALLNMLPKK
ncbi:MAG: hypothetical protein H7Z16_12585 [Pyrinomonadaceae bacterium]|nr:hypothetical protein [Pyrinomonadaceae bacterium]